jgi:hypothetical protein
MLVDRAAAVTRRMPVAARRHPGGWMYPPCVLLADTGLVTARLSDPG